MSAVSDPRAITARAVVSIFVRKRCDLAVALRPPYVLTPRPDDHPSLLTRPPPSHRTPLVGGIFTRGPGLSFTEATAVLPEGRISPEDAGIWNDDQTAAWAKLVEFAHSQGQKIGIQLAHAGRKASTVAPWLNMGAIATEAVGGWPEDVVGPSTVPYNEEFPQPKELDKAGIQRIVNAFIAAAKRSLAAGFDVIEIHSAHGYLLSEFLAPVANHRTDEYGGSFENRIRLLVEVVDGIRAVIPPTMPLFVRYVVRLSQQPAKS